MKQLAHLLQVCATTARWIADEGIPDRARIQAVAAQVDAMAAELDAISKTVNMLPLLCSTTKVCGEG